MQGLSHIQIHKKIYAALKEEMIQFIHSLEILINE